MFENHCIQNGTQKPRLSWRITRIIGLGLGGVFLAALFALLLGVVVQWLWNWLMPAIFGLKPITFWQAVGLLFLAKLFFGGFRHHPTPHSGKRISSDHADHWKHYKGFWREKGEKATEELIDQVRQEKRKEGEI
jgi:hypothetical protein